MIIIATNIIILKINKKCLNQKSNSLDLISVYNLINYKELVYGLYFIGQNIRNFQKFKKTFKFALVSETLEIERNRRKFGNTHIVSDHNSNFLKI